MCPGGTEMKANGHRNQERYLRMQTGGEIREVIHQLECKCMSGSPGGYPIDQCIHYRLRISIGVAWKLIEAGRWLFFAGNRRWVTRLKEKILRESDGMRRKEMRGFEDLVLVDMIVVLFLGMAVVGFAAKRWVDL
ncbi:hypothetical protein E3N88_23761 [Mikania micrantha]|uniref:Transmembrane protein n=1 Tax=Mikania micrantha TaxID=192012 RepID=A0A5N6NFT6_9ASTR|nr:hypothetical protein E3N88_23761 [Mikania micrantha]